MTIDDFEQQMFDLTNRAIESNMLSLSQILGITYAIHETVKAIFDYKVYQEVKAVKPTLPDNVTTLKQV